MHLYSDGVQMGPHDDCADDALSRNAGDQCRREEHEITPARPPDPCAERGQHHRQADDEREHPVDLLDRRVLRRHIDEVRVVAVRPVVAPETGTGQPHRGASDDDDPDQHQRRGADPAELVGGEPVRPYPLEGLPQSHHIARLRVATVPSCAQ